MQQQAADGLHTTNWVQCERCQKWRRITHQYASTVDDEVPWYCELNPDPPFADCNIPQEISDEQIDQEAAELAELSAQAAGSSAQLTPPPEAERDQQTLPKLPAVIQLISENYFSHRKRKQQDEDDIMVCHCPPPWRGGDGCGPNCINRMLCIECTEDFCPCESQCTNQMFTRKQYAKVAVRRAGPKGHGLYTEEDLAAGQFVIQYVGEVLEEEEYLRRKHYYIQTGQRHYYFMNIGNGEVIDACRKGNVARFINHSCEPNCETQKWMVQGELAIGLFTLRKIKAGEELTFDYNFERYGDKPMRCFCGSKKCRKFIGGTQETTANIVELGDAEDVTNDPTPLLVLEKETDSLVQAMLDKEVGVIQRNWDGKMLARLQQLCRQKGNEWSLAPDEAGLTASTAAAANSSFAEYQSEESSHAAGALPAATAASPASSSAPATASFVKSGLDGAESRPAGQMAAAKQAQKRKRKELDPEAAAAAALKKQQQEERKRQRLMKQQERQAKQQEAFVKRQEQELLRLQRAQQLKQQEHGGPARQQGKKQGKKRQWQQVSGDEGDGAAEGAEGQGAGAVSDKQQEPASHDSELEDDMSSQDFQQRDASGALDEVDDDNEESAESSSESGSEEEPQTDHVQQQQKRPLSSRVRVVQGRRLKPPLAPKPPPKETAAAAPTKRSFLTLAVSAPSRPVKKRSEVDRRLEQLVMNKSWKLKEPSKQSVIKVLRMFNLCDITPRQTENQAAQQQAKPEVSQGEPSEPKQEQQAANDAAGEAQSMGGAAVVDEAGLPALPSHLQPLQALRGAELEARERESEARFRARQRARMADMGMILDVVLASTSEKLKKEWLLCGILTQLQLALGRLPFTQEYSAVLVKVVGVLEHLPITSDDLYTMRSAHGTFADLIRRMASSAADWEVRRRSHQLLKRYSAASCSEATLLQLHNLPGPNGKSYLMSLHLPQTQLNTLLKLLPKQPEHTPRKRVGQKRGRTPPLRGPPGPGAGPPGGQHGPGPWAPPPLHAGPPPVGFGPASAGEPHSSPSTSHGGPAGGGPAAGAGALQEGGSSVAADSSGGWPPQQQQWDGSGLPPPPWAAGGGPPPHLLPPGLRPGPGRHPRHMGPWPPGPPGPYGGPPGPMPRPGSSGALVGASSHAGPGPSPGDWGHDRPEGPPGPPEGHGTAAGQQQGGGPGSIGGRVGGGPADRSPGPDGGPYGPWGSPDWQGRPPRGDWDAGGPGGRFPPGRYGPPGGPGPYDGGPMPYSHRERERERRGWGRREYDWEPEHERGREREWGPRYDDGPPDGGYPDRQEAEAAAAKRQRREPRDGPGGQWGPYGSPHDMPPHRMPPPGPWHGEGGPYGGRDGPRGGGPPWVGDLSDDPLPGEPGWQQQEAGGGGRGSRQGGWRERQQGHPAADPCLVPREAAVEDLFVLGVAGSAVPASDWQEWGVAVGPAAADGPLSPIVSGKFSPVLPAGGPGRPGSRPHTPHLPPGDKRLGMEDVFSVMPDPMLATRTPGVPISACVADAGPPGQQPWGGEGAGWGQRPPSRGPPAGAGPGPSSSRRPLGTGSEQHPLGANQQQQQDTPQQQWPDSWDQPGPDFEAFVGEAVKHRLGKYVQPDHPNRITKEEAQQLYKKLRRQIVEKEAAACADRQAAGSSKPIERSKLEANIKEFVRLSIRRLHAARPGGAAGGLGAAGGGLHPGGMNGL